MSRCRLASFARACLLLLAGCCCSRGGAESNVAVYMPDLVEAKLGDTAIIKCEFALPENGSYVYVNWYSMEKGKMERKKIIYMVQGKEHQDEPLNDRLSITPDFFLKISKVVLQDAKNYVCQVGFGMHGVAENRSELRVSKAPEKPEIQRTNRGISTGDPHLSEIATCTSRNGYPTPTLTWYKNEVPLKLDGNEIEIRPGLIKESSGLWTVRSTLSAKVTKEDRSAEFYCQVSYSLMGNNKTSKSDSFKVDVHYPSESLRFVIDAPGPDVKEGDNVTLRCEADGNPPPLYTLYRMEEKEVLEQDSEQGFLHLYNITKERSGAYQCKVLDLQDVMPEELTANVTLLVNYLDEPAITSVPPVTSLRQLQEGEDALLTCNATGSKPLVFHWEKKGKVIEKGNLLNLTNVSYNTSGKYTCVVQMPMPDTPAISRSKLVQVTVHAKPVLVARKEVVHVRSGEMVNLTCVGYSISTLQISWSVNGSVSTSGLPGGHQRTSTVLFQVTEALLESGVNCSAKNKMGITQHHFMLAQRQEGGTPHAKTEQTAQESKGVIIVAVVICILAIAVLGAVLYFLHKKGKLTCGRSGKQEITKPEAHKDEIVVEVKSDKLPEEAGLLQGANGEKKSASDQGEKYIDLRN
ncbi:cell surface glycoprotein MUC18 [Zootoca vivipara]|uniref:cell surface glycoprotein MUC18 n=1 Tax=Zootoca vivipara TaxID=8524 RepID=UPI00293BA158|nr:cell surface glycoprotein MUC18 [Zootoca vivipara]